MEDAEDFGRFMEAVRERQLAQVGRSIIDDRQALASEIVPLSWRLVPGNQRPQIEVSHKDGQQRWTV